MIKNREDTVDGTVDSRHHPHRQHYSRRGPLPATTHRIHNLNLPRTTSARGPSNPMGSVLRQVSDFESDMGREGALGRSLEHDRPSQLNSKRMDC